MDFNWEIYAELNNDLVKRGLTTKEQLEHYYLINNNKEHRPIKITDKYVDFDLAQYRKNYKDLHYLTDTQIIIHWLRHGVKEKRTYYKIEKNVQPVKVVQAVQNIKTINNDEILVPKNTDAFDDLKKVQYINQKNLEALKNYVLRKDIIYTLPNKHKKIIEYIKDENVDNREVLLTIADSLYPAFGGGENWLLDINKLVDKEYFCVAVCFTDVFNKSSFQDITYIKHQNVHIVQMPLVVRDIIEIIKLLNPVCISHQGLNRLLFCKIAKLLKINFLTGCCFWNDLITTNCDYFNINMMNRKYTKDINLDIVLKDSNTYLASEFMKDVVDKIIPNLKIDVIPTISYHSHYLNNNSTEIDGRKYVCILNSHFLKGGQELSYLLKNLDINIPILAIITERDTNDDKITELFKERNARMDINKLYRSKSNNINEIYNICRVLLVPSILDETYCSVAYEGMQLGLPMISYRTGNLVYLLDKYNNNTFIDMPIKKENIDTVEDTKIDDETLKKWVKEVEKKYVDCKLEKMSMYKTIEKETKLKLISKIKKNRADTEDKGMIGFFCPFADQGLGIQCREYITYLNNNGYKTAVYSFKPYFAAQTDMSEWNYENIFYSNKTKEETILEDIIEFVFKYNVKTIFIPEICYRQIYQKIDYFKCLGVKIVGIINIELLRYTELGYYHYFDLILVNNESSYNILKRILPNNNIKLLGFNNHYMKKSLSIRNDKINLPNETINIATFGGLNSFVRKNIDKTYLVFKQLETQYKTNKKYNYKLNIYIQGVDNAAQPIIQLKDTETISIHFKNYSYSEIIENIKKNDIIIHLGDHEGLGLGFYEALNNNKLLITLDTYPNKEFIDKENGYLINCKFEELIDNNEGIINRALVNLDHYYKLMESILIMSNRQKLYNQLLKNKNIVNNYDKNFESILKQL